MPQLLVERRALSRRGDPAAGLSLAGRQPRRGQGRASRQPRGSVPALSLPHDHELHPRPTPRASIPPRRSARSRSCWSSARSSRVRPRPRPPGRALLPLPPVTETGGFQYLFKRIAALAALMCAGALPANAGQTFDAVKAKGLRPVRGQHRHWPASPSPTSQGKWTGLDVDLCKAIAVAMFGDADQGEIHPDHRPATLRGASVGRGRRHHPQCDADPAARHPSSASTAPASISRTGRVSLAAAKSGIEERQGTERRRPSASSPARPPSSTSRTISARTR